MASRKIKDHQITASSEWNGSLRASNARLDFAKGSGSWSSRRNDLHQWLEIDFEYRGTITDILTQGRGSHQQWVKSYTLSYSDDGIKFIPYRKNGKDKVRFIRFVHQILFFSTHVYVANIIALRFSSDKVKAKC